MRIPCRFCAKRNAEELALGRGRYIDALEKIDAKRTSRTRNFYKTS